MNEKLVLAPLFAAALAIGAFAVCQREGRVLTDRYHHLGNDTTKDWKEADPKPEGQRLDLAFESRANVGEWTLFLEQRSIDDPWHLRMNGVEFAVLKPGPELRERFYPVPAGLVREGSNVLAVVPDQPNDDVVIGKVRLVERSLREMFGTLPVSVIVWDETTAALIPARVTFVDATGVLAPIYYAEQPETAVRDGVIYVAKEARIELPRGKYTCFATRGCEWSCSRVEIDVQPGAPNVVAHTLRRELDTTGFIAADTHLHTLQFSGHGDASALERQVTLAGEGVEFAVATDHNHFTDYVPYQRELGLSAYYTAVTGNEVTTKTGHFNGFPFDPAGKLPDHMLEDYPAIVAGIRERGASVVILNHPRWPNHDNSPFTNNKLDRDTGAFGTGLALTVDATELVNSTVVEGDPLFLFHDWFALLNRGVRIFAVGTSDSHTVGDPVGQGRTYVVSATDDPTKIDVDAVCEAIKNGHTSIGMGMFVTVLVSGQARMGDTLVNAPDAGIHVQLRVQAPSWIVPRNAIVFLNGASVAERAVPTVHGKSTDATMDFQVASYGLDDCWMVCVVTGDPAQGSFWPSTNPYTVAATNPVFIDNWVDPAAETGWKSPRESALALLERYGANGKVLEGVDEAISVHLLDLLAEKLRAAGKSSAEVREQVLEIASHANPAFKGVRRFLARL